MADRRYVVTGPAAVVRLGGRRVTLERGGIVPDGADPDHLAHLASIGLVAVAEQEPESEPVSGLDDMTVAQLREHAAAAGVDLGEAAKKTEILAALKADRG